MCGSPHWGSSFCILPSRFWAAQMALVVKNSNANAGDLRDAGSIPGSGRSPGRVNGNPLQRIPRTEEPGEPQPMGSQSLTQLSTHALPLLTAPPLPVISQKQRVATSGNGLGSGAKDLLRPRWLFMKWVGLWGILIFIRGGVSSRRELREGSKILLREDGTMESGGGAFFPLGLLGGF